MNIGIYIYDQAEVLDFAGPFEVFSTAKRLGAEHWNVYLIAEAPTVVARGGFTVKTDFTLNNAPTLDVLVVVGGVHTAELEKPTVLSWIAKTAAHTQLTASVCTGVFLLAEAGVVTTQPVTTHWEDITDLKTRYPTLQVLEEQRWVEEGKLITSGGISSGIDMSLFLVSKLASAELAKRTARQMEYRWDSAYTTKNAIK